MLRFARSIVDTISNPLLLIDGDFKVVQGNRSFHSTFGVTPEDIQGNSFLEIQNGQWNVESMREGLLRMAAADGEISELEVRHDFSGLGGGIFIISAKHVREDDGRAFMILISIEDVTERVRAHELLESLNEVLEDKVKQRTNQLEKVNEELEAFCYSVSHDLRAPLRALDGFSSELIRTYGSVLDTKGQHYLNRIQANSRRMGELIDDLLRLSRITRGELDCGHVDLSLMVKEVSNNLMAAEPLRSVNLTIEPNMQIYGDSTLLRVALTNLLANAWKFTLSATTPEVQVMMDRSLEPDTFFVRDNGAGFCMDHYDKLFAPFQRLHSQREFPGTGIGLAIVQRIMSRHEGRIWAHAEPGKGATFYCHIPSHGIIQ